MSLSQYKRISTGYSPRPLQEILHRSLKRFNVLVCHRRFGKSIFSINEMIDRGLSCPHLNPQCAYLAPLYGQAKRVAWTALKQYTAALPGAVPNEADLRIDVPRGKDTVRFTLLGADNPAALKGIYLDFVVLDEYADMNPTVWSEVIRPTLSDRLGSAIFIGTPKGQNGFYDLYQRAKSGDHPEWLAAMYKASETGIISKEELASARAEMTDDEYEQEFECSFNAGLVGAYFAKELSKAESEGRITRVPYDRMYPVDVYFDLGWNDVTSVWFVQSTRTEHRILNYYETSGLDIAQILPELRSKGYNLDYFVLPHDGDNKNVATGKSVRDVLWANGVRRIRMVPRVQYKRDSINAARMVMSKCVFDQTNCAKGLKHLAAYQRKYDPKNEVFSETPLHNHASNAADAFQTFAMGVRENQNRQEHNGRYSEEAGPSTAESDFNPFERRAT